MMRFLLFVAMIVAGVAFLCVGMCSTPSKPPPQGLKNFSQYLNLKPGTKVKVHMIWQIKGGPESVRDVIQDAISKAPMSGTLKSIDERQVAIRIGDGDAAMILAPGQVRSIEVDETPGR